MNLVAHYASHSSKMGMFRESEKDKNHVDREGVTLCGHSHLHREVVAYGDIELLEEIARQAGVSAVSPHLHPLDLHKRVLNGLERDTRFEKFLFRCCDCNGIREIRVRAYKLKECEDHA